MVSQVVAEHLAEQFPAFSVTFSTPRSNITEQFICVRCDTESLINGQPEEASISIISEGASLQELKSAMNLLRNLHVGTTYFQWTRFIRSNDFDIPIPGGQSIPCTQSSWLSLCSES